MDREGFRNRLKQYKLAREENPGLKYWEWKDIPKYDEGTHSVAAGESLSSIAKKYKLNLQDLIDYNPQIKNPNVIGIGQEINIRDNSLLPTTEWVDYRELRLKERDIADSTTTINYSVKSGDSLSKIAKDNGLTLKQLLMQNPQITDTNKISIGQNLSITTTKDGNMAAILSVSHRGNYVVVDKVNKKLTVYNKDNKPIYVTDNIATGASGDDYNTITYVDANGVIRNMQGNNSTPAGITEITGKGVYHGAKSFTRGRYNRLTGNFDDDIASSFHTGRIDIGSNGCVRLPKKELDDLNNLIKRGTKVYTLPEQEGSRFVKKDNKLSFVADSPYGTNTGKTKYWDDYNTYVDATYNPLAIVYAGDYEGLSDEYINNSTAFANALSSNKQALQKELGLDSATYNDLAELALGIAQQESNFGTSVRKKIKDVVSDGILDSVKKITRGKSSARSVGMTQIKMSADNDWMQQFYKKHNITPDNILDSAELSAIATIGRLAHMYNNEVRGRTFTGENGISIDPIDAVLYKYMGKNKELTGKTATPEKNIYIQNVKKYAKDWDLLSQTESFAEGGEVGDKKAIPTQEEYIAEQIAARKTAALEKSLSRTMPRVPQGIKTGERWNPVTKKVEDIHECGPSCAYTFSDNYGLNWMCSEDFKQNHANYGWRLIPWESRQPGDAVLIVDDKGTARHTMMYDSDNAQGKPLFNHSNGGHDESAIRKKAKYPHHNPYLTYEFVGTPADSIQWINDYKKIYGFAEGTDGVLESYYNPTTVEGVLAKTALQLADPTGVSSYPDVWYSGKEFLKSPSWAKLGDVGLNTLSALPLIGKVTAPFKAAKMAKLLTRIEDANALVKGVEKANRLNRAIDTVPELLPVVRRGAEKVQDVTSSLITNPMFNYISNQNKFDLVRNYRNVNAAVDAVNISNNTADLTQGIGTLLGYADGGEVTGPPTYEQWDADMNQYNPTILDNASMYWSLEAAKKDLHKQAMGLPGYAPMWHEYVRSLPKADPDINQFVDDLWANENPNNVGLKNGKYYPHNSPEGGKPTIGPGFKLGSGSHNISTKEANRGMTKKRLNQEARRIGKQHLNAVDQFINYGQTTNPADTVSPQIKMGLMDLRHQVGPLNEWGNLRQAVLNGDLEGIRKESTVTWNDNGKTKVDKRRKKIRDEKYFYYE